MVKPEKDEALRRLFSLVLPHLNEPSCLLWLLCLYENIAP